MVAYFPVFINMEGKKVLVIGGGRIATRRIGTLLEFGAAITVAAGSFTDEILTWGQDGRLKIIARNFTADDIKGQELVLSATDDRQTENDVFDRCKEAGIPVNLASDQTKCDFFFPAVVRSDDMVIGLTSGGRDHHAVKLMAEKLRGIMEGEAMSQVIRIGSRESKLAVVQAEMLIAHIKEADASAKVELVTMKTTGDLVLDRALDKIGGKGLFVKELDLALLENRTDLSVHSLKDVPMEVPNELPLLGFSKREDPRDVLVLPKGVLEWDPSLPIGCSSRRRILQMQKLCPNAVFLGVRGNVQTRLSKLDSGQYSALILAAAGLHRLGLEGRISRYFSTEEMIPAAGQGILAVQGRKGTKLDCLQSFFDEDAAYAALCERAFIRRCEGGCSSPTAAHAVIEGSRIWLSGLYYDEASGKHRIGTIEGRKEEAELLGLRLAEKLILEID